MKILSTIILIAASICCSESLRADFTLPTDFDTDLATSESTSFYYYSEQGDFIGQGQEVFLTPMDGNFNINNNFDNGISVITPGLLTSYNTSFAAPFQQLLEVGFLYEDATRFPFQEDFEPGLSVSGDGRGCNTLTGQFQVIELEYDGSGNPIAFDAVFEQHCEGATPALFGRIRFNASAVPEPSSSICVLGLFVLARRRR